MSKHGWTYKKLGEICEVLNGLWVGKKEPFVNIAVIRNTNFSKDCKLKLDDVAYIDVEERQFATRKLQVGDIIIEKSGGSDKQPVGRPVLFNIPDGEYSFSNFTSTLRLTDKSIFPPFLHYCLYGYYRNGETKKMQSKTTGLRNLDMKAYLRLAIPYFEIGEQERIVAELDLLQGIIEKKKEQLKAYDQLAQSIFYIMFGDPIDNPKGWEVKKLGELVSLITDGDWIESKDQSDNGIRLIQTGNIGSGFFIAKDDKPHFISETTFHSLGCTEVFGGDCLISRLPSPVGRACLIPKTDYRMITAVDCTIVRFRNIILPQFFINYSLSSGYQAEIDRKTTGTTRKRISRKNLEIIPVPLPPLTLQEEFAEKVEAIERQKALVQQSIDETQTMFDCTMEKYFG